jgi:acyl-CoA synthetase (AMP-forming)/AMP-acid ligase II
MRNGRVRATAPGYAGGVRTLWQLLAARAAASPDRPMLLDERDRRVGFAEFRARAERVAAGLAALGIGAGTPVTWQLPTRIESVLLSMALARLGAVQNPILPIYREREVGAVLAETGARWLVVPGLFRGFDHGALARTLKARAQEDFQILNADEPLPEGDPATLPPPPEDGDAVRWIYSTSGTTAAPKCARHTDATLIAGGTGLASALAAGPDDVGSIAFPYTHIGGPDYLVMGLLSGMAVVLLESFVPEQALAVFRRHGVTLAGGSTAFYQAFLAEQRRRPGEKLLPSLRALAGGGAPKPPELFWQVQRELGVPILHGYGMTECPMIASGAPGDSDEQLANTDGRPVVGCQVRVVEGEICVRGPMLCRGYTDPALTTEAFDADGFFHTGDLGQLRPDGHVVLTGRKKELIIRKGENISPREIEDLLAAHPSVAAVAVIGLPDAERGERVCAVVETRPGVPPLDFAALQAHCRAAGLMAQKIPEQLELVDALPRNATLKILKHELRERFSREAPSSRLDAEEAAGDRSRLRR